MTVQTDETQHSAEFLLVINFVHMNNTCIHTRIGWMDDMILHPFDQYFSYSRMMGG